MCELPLLRSLMLVVFDGGFFLLLLRPPRTTLTDTLFPYTARCRSGQQSRRAITLLTLFGGLASTVCWPLSAYLVEAVGWRGTCATYARSEEHTSELQSLMRISYAVFRWKKKRDKEPPGHRHRSSTMHDATPSTNNRRSVRTHT